MSLLEILAAGLERPRQITSQVANHITETHGITRDEIGGFLTGQVADLEDYEIDLIFSPLFTPSLADQMPAAELLGSESISPDQWPDLIRELVARPVRGQFITEDGVTHSLPLREVTVERWVNRLRLDGTIHAEVLALIAGRPEGEDRALLKAIGRRAIWEDSGRREILAIYLERAGDAFRADDLESLLKLLETYQPAGRSELLDQIPHWQRVLRQEISEADAKPFFNERVKELHGGGRDQRHGSSDRTEALQGELAQLDRLQAILAA